MNIKELGSEIFYKMHDYSQLVIDLVQETESLIFDSESNLEDFGALSYDVTNVIQIIENNKQSDFDALIHLSKILEEKQSSIK